MSEQLRFEGYVEAYVVVEGALDNAETFEYGEGDALDAWIQTQKFDAMAHPEQRTEIYLTSHDHPVEVEDCSCVQYLTDHHPFWAFGPLPEQIEES